ncbi:MAG: calcium/sodium antiporter [Candidatus Omnitrophica bacterium]|nr:calcium/sodium antiporter [Candidatus Omnitrophota bacterium]
MSPLIINAIIFGTGLLVLIYSSDWFIQSSVRLSYLLKLSPLFIGLVIVAFGTSAPEGGVGIMAAIHNREGIALGNIIGSNIANIGLILGVCALISPLKVNKDALRRELPIMIAAVLLLFVLSFDLVLSRSDGLILLACFFAFLITSYKGAKEFFDPSEIEGFEFRAIFKKSNTIRVAFFISFLSLLGVVLGADLMVRGGANLAKYFGVSPWVIGITVFAIGTSLPELAASLVAAQKKMSSISVGNVVGSNIFNILLVLGVVACIRPIHIDASILRFELLVLLLFSVVAFVFMKTRHGIGRREGAIFFLGYLIFLIILFK